MDDPPSRVFYLPFALTLIIIHDILGPGWKLVYLIDSFYLANRELLGRSAKYSFPSAICILFWDPAGGSLSINLIDSFSLANREFSIRQFILLVRVTPMKFVDSVDSFYSANIILFEKYYARSDILCSPSENCTSLMTMTLTSLLIWPIRSIRRTDTFNDTT